MTGISTWDDITPEMISNFTWGNVTPAMASAEYTATATPVSADVIGDVTKADPVKQDYLAWQVGFWINAICNPIIMAFGLSGNAMTIFIIATCVIREKTTCMYMMAVAASDFLILAMDFVFWMAQHLNVIWYGVWSCKIVLFLFYFSIHHSVAQLVAMTAERFIAVTFPLKAAVLITRRRTKFIIFCIFLAIVAIEAQAFWTRTVVEYADNSTSCLFSNSATLDDDFGIFHVYIWPWLDAFLYSFIPLTSIFILNLLILRQIIKSHRDKRRLTKDTGGTAKGLQSEQERQITLMLFTVSTAFFILTCPIAIILILEKNISLFETASGAAGHFLMRKTVNQLMYMNHAINFLLYVFTGNVFRQRFKTVFCCVKESPDRSNQCGNRTTLSSISTSVSNSTIASA